MARSAEASTPAARAVDAPPRNTSAQGHWGNVAKRLRRDKATLFFGLLLLLVFLSALFAPLIAPADPYAPRMLKRLKRSEERGEGKEWVSTCRSWWSPYN